MNPSSLVGYRLKEERERLFRSQADAGQAVGVSREMWGRYERGAMPGGETLITFAAIGMDVTYILTGKRSQLIESKPDEEMLMNAYRQATTPQKQAILGAALGMSSLATASKAETKAPVFQHNTGSGVVQIGSVGGNAGVERPLNKSRSKRGS